MSLAEWVDGPSPGRPDRLTCTPAPVPGRDERDPPSPSGGRERAVHRRGALVTPRNEPGDDGSPAGAAEAGTINPFGEIH